jgi:endonuclease/exonuclease/phosphatase family metal-dependent hydrolase
LLLCLFLALPAHAADLKLAAWDLSWLSTRQDQLPSNVRIKRPEDIATLRRYALQLDADLVAFSEVDGPEIAAQVFPADKYAIHITSDDVVLRVGFAVRRGMSFAANADVDGLDLYKNAKYHLRSGADITLDLPTGKLRLLAVHLKAGCREGPVQTSDDPACRTLARQLPVLQQWMAARDKEGTPFVLIGDFGRLMAGEDDFLAALQHTSPLTLTDAGQNSPCWGGAAFLDHILLGGSAREWLQPDSLRVLVYKETEAAMKPRLSNRCPVSVKLRTP